MKDIHAHKILILDFGSQYTQLIARRIRELGVYCELHPYDWSDEDIQAFNPQGIILSGGPETVTLDDTPRVSDRVWQLGCPILGICYGMQTMAQQLGGCVEVGEQREFGYVKVELHGHSYLFKEIEDQENADGAALLDVWMSHGDKVTQIPPAFKVIAKTASAPIAAMADEARQFYGVQFHPEVTHTRQGTRILQRFVREICGCDALWTSSNIIENMLNHVRKIVGNEQVILGLSGGVDSAVVAALLHRAIGDQLICIFVDNGLLRLNESAQVKNTFEKHFGLTVITAKAQSRFLSALKGVADPEEKRKIIGKEFVTVFEEASQQFPNVKWLAQGTIYPDVIESAGAKTGKAQVIKSHHNVGGLPEIMALKLIEPLRELFKDEVRTIGLELGLPYDMVYRHPFPGPGLGVRILGEIKAEAIELLKKADHIFLEELRKHDLYDKVSQAFAVFLPVNSVGVIGDARQYAPVIALRAVVTVDFMTAHVASFSTEFLTLVANRIVNEVRGISRVVYDITGKPPATIEWE